MSQCRRFLVRRGSYFQTRCCIPLDVWAFQWKEESRKRMCLWIKVTAPALGECWWCSKVWCFGWCWASERRSVEHLPAIEWSPGTAPVGSPYSQSHDSSSAWKLGKENTPVLTQLSSARSPWSSVPWAVQTQRPRPSRPALEGDASGGGCLGLCLFRGITCSLHASLWARLMVGLLRKSSVPAHIPLVLARSFPLTSS